MNDDLRRRIAEALGWKDVHSAGVELIGVAPGTDNAYRTTFASHGYSLVPDWPADANAALALPIGEDYFFDLRGNPLRGYTAQVRRDFSSETVPDDMVSRKPAEAAARAWLAWKEAKQ